MNNPVPVVNQATNTPAVAPTTTATPPPATVTPPVVAAPPAPAAGEKAKALTEKLRADSAKRRETAARAEAAEQSARQNAWHREQAEQRAKAAEAEAARVRGQIEAAGKDPYKLLEAAGQTPEQIVERARIESNPVELLKRELAELKAKAAEAERVAAEREAKTAEAQKRAENAAIVAREEAQFVTEAKDPKAYPHLSKLRPYAILAEAQRITMEAYRRAEEEGRPPPRFENRELLAYLEKQWSTAEVFAASGKSTGAPGDGGSTVQAALGNSAAGTDSPGAGSRTATNGDASLTLSLPPATGKLTKAQEKAAALAVYQAAKARSRATG